MSAANESRDLELDLTAFSMPVDVDAAWAIVLADVRREEADAELVHDAPRDPDLDAMTADQRESWASEDGIGRAETRRRLALVDAREPVDRSSTAEASGWGDVPLDGILAQIEAGTFSLPTPSVGMLADGSSGLFYPGRVNGVAGESGAGKGWIALMVAAEQMGLGRDAYYLDFEDSPALALLRLVRVLEVAPALVRDRFHYVHPSHHDVEGIAELVARVAATPGALVVVDSTGESMAAAGLNQNHDEEVAAWFQSLAHPLADQGGATVLLLDHMVKAEDGGLWPIGSQRKRAAITGAQYVAEVADPFSKSKNGMVALRVAKDRHGAREARSVATYVQFQHPIKSMTTQPDGTTLIELGEELSISFGLGKSADQIKADRDAKAAAAVNLDVTDLDRLTPQPKSQRDVMTRMGWGAKRAMTALRAWREQNGSPS